MAPGTAHGEQFKNSGYLHCACECMCMYIFMYVHVVYIHTQTDLIALPPIVANRVLKRQPMNILYLKNHLMSVHQSPTLPLPPLPHTEDVVTEHQHSHSGCHFEEPLSIRAFTNERTESMKRANGDRDSHSWSSPAVTVQQSHTGSDHTHTQKRKKT